MTRLRLGTRGSQLALYQARAVASQIVERAGIDCELVIIRTSGDQLADRPLSEIGGKRLFVKEIEDALLDGIVDLAVHSSKDLAAELPQGLEIGAALPREDPADVLVQRGRAKSDFTTLAAQLGKARIGTGSIRRIAQLRRILSAASFEPIRGNLDTRLRKLDAGDYDVIVMAAAGLRRLNLADRISSVIPPDTCVPAPGQGIIAVEVRAEDVRARAAVAGLNDRDTAVALTAERALVAALGGGCQMPVGGYCRVRNGVADLLGVVASVDGSQLVRQRKVGPRDAARDLGRELGEQLLRDGADEILADAQAEGDRVADPQGP